MAGAPRPGAKPGLEPLLGAEGCARLQRGLVARALAWAAETTDAVFVACEPSGAEDEIAALAPPGATVFAQAGDHLGVRLEDAVARAAEAHDGPVVVVGTDQPALSASHAWAVADDLRDGVDVCLGPATGGGWYLLGAARPHPALFAIDPEAWGGRHVMGMTLQSVLGAGLSVGWLRSERDLCHPADAAALLADPCAPADIRAALEG